MVSLLKNWLGLVLVYGVTTRGSCLYLVMLCMWLCSFPIDGLLAALLFQFSSHWFPLHCFVIDGVDCLRAEFVELVLA